jgi:glutamate formiminotransferase
MPLLTIPNVSEGRSAAVVSKLAAALEGARCRVLDVHSDGVHNRTVFTATGAVVRGAGQLARAAVSLIDLATHEGAHPRVGIVDVCPFVPHDEPMGAAIEAAHAAGTEIAESAGLPVYFYDYAAREPRSLPEIRSGGLGVLIERARDGFTPDLGPREIDPHRGVVCVGARDVLVAFNVWIKGDVETARAIAAAVRAREGGLSGVRALGVEFGPGRAQVSMNLTAP